MWSDVLSLSPACLDNSNLSAASGSSSQVFPLLQGAEGVKLAQYLLLHMEFV